MQLPLQNQQKVVFYIDEKRVMCYNYNVEVFFDRHIYGDITMDNNELIKFEKRLQLKYGSFL